MSTKFSGRFNANYNRQERLKTAIANIFRYCCTQYWRSNKLTIELIALKAQQDYQKLPQRDKQYIEGYIAGMRYAKIDDPHTHTHVYLCQDGKYREQGAYDYPNNGTPQILVKDTCCLVWRNAPTFLWYASDDTLKAIRNFGGQMRDTKYCTILIDKLEKPVRIKRKG